MTSEGQQSVAVAGVVPGGARRGPLEPGRVGRRSARWLVAALTGREGPGLWSRDPAEVPADLAWAAEFHGVQGWVRRRARTEGLSLPAVDLAVSAAVARHQRALADLSLLDEVLRGNGVDFLVVKGPALAALYPSPDLRSYVDLDVLVRPDDLGTAVRALSAASFALVDANWPMLERSGVRELRLAGPTGGPLDLHWSLRAGGPEADTSPTVAQLLESSRALPLDGSSIHTTGWADTVVHVAVHAAASGGHRLIWLADLRAALGDGVDADAVARLVRRAREWGAAPALHLMLRRAERIIGLPLPDGLLDGLVDPGAWRALSAAVDRVFAPERVGTRGSVSRMVARSCGPTPRASLLALARKARAVTLSGGRPTSPGAAELLDARDPSSALFPSGGPSAAEAFFANVAREGRAAGR